MSTVLVIEDSEETRALIRDALAGSDCVGRVLEARDGVQGLKLLLSEPVDLVLCDLELPGLKGDSLLRMKKGGAIEAPFVLLTAVTDPLRRARLLQEGAADAITKPFFAVDLIARVELHLRLQRSQRELVEKNRLLEEQAHTDALTRLTNRRGLDQALQREVARAVRSGTPLSLVLVDVDHFKRVNDRWGHPAGDEVLRHLATVLDRNRRITDYAGRYGGEEFLLILTNSSEEGASIYAERCRQQIAALRIPLENGQDIGVTVSLGVAGRHEAESAEELIAAADRALYLAKEGGRNRVARASVRAG